MASTFRRTASTRLERCERQPHESNERALDSLRDCIRWSRPRGVMRSIGWSFARNATGGRLAGDWGRTRARSAKIAAVDILRHERGLADFDHPRLVALNEFLAQTGLTNFRGRARDYGRRCYARALTLALSLFLPRSLDGGGCLVWSWVRWVSSFTCRSLASDESIQLHRSIAGRAEHHRAQLANRPSVCERY